MHFPIDNYFGFYAAYVMQFIWGSFYTYWVAVFLFLYITLYFCGDAIAKDLMGLVSDMNLVFSEKTEKNSNKIEKSQLLLNDWIDLHNDLLR